MKINRLTRFPYPVLEEYTDDYKSGDFSVGVEISESIKTGALVIHYNVQLTEETLSGYLENNSAKACLFITCLETYYNTLHEIAAPVGKLEVKQGSLFGNVRLLPLIVLTDKASRLESKNFHEDYGDQVFPLEEGEILAIGEEYVINVGREKLAPIESIFNLAVNDSVPKGQFQVDLDEEKITILAEKNTYQSIYSIRNTSFGKSMVLNSVYLPAIMEILSVLQQDPGSYQEKRWFGVFEAKCIHENINLENPDLLKDSQRLLKTPFSRVVSLMQEMD